MTKSKTKPVRRTKEQKRAAESALLAALAASEQARAENLESDSIIASCGCGTKTNEVRFHKPGCKYRLICERDDARKARAAAVAAVERVEALTLEMARRHNELLDIAGDLCRYGGHEECESQEQHVAYAATVQRFDAFWAKHVRRLDNPAATAPASEQPERREGGAS